MLLSEMTTGKDEWRGVMGQVPGCVASASEEGVEGVEGQVEDFGRAPRIRDRESASP